MTDGRGAGAGSDALIKDVLASLASEVTVSPDAYHQVRAEWLRRQRRRRRLGIGVATALIAAADVVGLWALERADNGGLIFDDRAPGQQQEPSGPRIGQP